MRRALVAAALLFAGASSGGAWEVPRIELFCGKPADRFPDLTYRFYLEHYGEEVDRPAESDCALSPATRSQLTGYAELSLARLEEIGFSSPSPHRLGPVVRGAAGTPVVRFYADPAFDGYMNTLAPCLASGEPLHDLLSIVTLNPRFPEAFSSPTILRAMAHEMVHVLQNAYALKTKPHTDRCGLDAAWFLEGTADALSVDISRRSFPSYNPPLLVRGSKSYYGLRPYDRALTWSPREGEAGFLDRHGHPVIPDYRTSSLYMHLADQYFEGDYGWLDGFFRVPDPEPGGDDWLAWFDHLLEKGTTGPKLPLYLVFPDFLGNYSTWGTKKHPHIGEERWLEPSFGGCRYVGLSHAEPVREIEVELEPISGQCLRVWSSDIAPGEVAQVKVMVYGQSEEEVDNLHLAVARMSAKVLELGGGAYDCWELSKSHRGEPVCISKPYTGRKDAGKDSGTKADRGAAGWAKTWASVHQEGTEGVLDNLYVLVHAPVEPRIARHAAGKERNQRVRVVVALDYPTFETTTHGAAGKTTASIDNQRIEPVPMASGEDAMAGMFAAAAGDPEALSKLPFLMNNIPSLAGLGAPSPVAGNTMAAAAADAAGGAATARDGIASVTIERAETSAAGGGIELEPTLQLQLMVAEGTIPFGATGSYPAYVLGTDVKAMSEVTRGASTAALIANPQAVAATLLGPQMTNLYPDRPSATVEVLQFDDALLRLRVSGQYCKGPDWDAQGKRCRVPQRFSGEILKPFGWTYDPENPFVSVDTPGMAIYRRQMHELLRQRGLPLPPMPGTTLPGDGGPDDGGGAGDGGGSGSGGGALCDCSCEAFQRLRQLGKENKEKGAERPAAEMTSLAQCSMECMGAWMSCPKKGR